MDVYPNIYLYRVQHILHANYSQMYLQFIFTLIYSSFVCSLDCYQKVVKILDAKSSFLYTKYSVDGELDGFISVIFAIYAAQHTKNGGINSTGICFMLDVSPFLCALLINNVEWSNLNSFIWINEHLFRIYHTSLNLLNLNIYYNRNHAVA